MTRKKVFGFRRGSGGGGCYDEGEEVRNMGKDFTRLDTLAYHHHRPSLDGWIAVAERCEALRSLYTVVEMIIVHGGVSTVPLQHAVKS